MDYEKDFETRDVVDLDVKGYKLGDFKYKPQNAGQESEWLDQYMGVDKKGKPVTNFNMLNKLKLNTVSAVPYPKELIHKMIGIDTEWADMNIDQKYTLLGKLKGPIFDKILAAIANIDNEEEGKKKE